jgi:pyruvate-ferredoxin/flavodoxin oxidoreductase
MYSENRFKMLTKSNPKEAKRLLMVAKQDVIDRWKQYEYMASMPSRPDGNQKDN